MIFQNWHRVSLSAGDSILMAVVSKEYSIRTKLLGSHIRMLKKNISRLRPADNANPNLSVAPGLAFVNFIHSTWVWRVGWAFIPIAVILMAIGFHRYYKIDRMIRAIRNSSVPLKKRLVHHHRKLAVTATRAGNRRLLLLAALAHPSNRDFGEAEQCLNEMFKQNRKWFPQFKS